MPDLTSFYADRASLGVADAAVPASPLRLGALAAASGGAARLALDASGNVTAGVLTAADIPPAFVRRDVAETIGADWLWSSGKTIAFASGPLAPPAATSRSAGTRLILEPVGASTEYAIGRESGALWTSVPALTAHRFYQGATERLRLDTDGTLRVLGGAGAIVLQSAADGSGSVAAAMNLGVTAAGAITLSSNGQILPSLNYRENLGAINRKYLTLHCAELWAETLVAAQTMATIGGRLLIGPTTTLTRDMPIASATLYVKHNFFRLHTPGDEFGSKVILEAGGKFEVVAIDSQATPVLTAEGDYAYAVVRNWDGSGANDWYAGDAAFDTGKVSAPAGAFIDLYSVAGVRPGSTAGPAIVGNVRTGPNAADWREHWAIGNLNGVYGNTSGKFGAAFGDANAVHIQIDAVDGFCIRTGGGGAGVPGTIIGQWSMANVLTLGYPGGCQIVLNPADGAIKMQANGVDKIVLLATGVALLHQGLILGAGAGTAPYVRSSGATAWNAGAGFYLDAIADTNVGRALIGNSAGRRLQWDGASLKVISDGFILDENGITMGQHAGGSPTESGKIIKFGVTGALMWDTATGGGRFELLRGNQIRIEAGSSGGQGIELQAGGSGIDRVILQLVSVSSGQSQMVLGGLSTGGVTYPRFVPATDAVSDIGAATARWRTVYALNFTGAGRMSSGYSTIGNTTSPPGSYLLELSLNAAAKPVSSTWSILAVDRDAMDAIETVGADAALATVRQVPIVRYRVRATGEPAIGIVAPDAADLLPLSVRARADGVLDWDAHELLMLNVAAVQAIAARLEAIERSERN